MIHFAYLVLFFIASTKNSEGRIIQAILGRNVSISFTLITKDAINIYHDSFRFLTVWPDGHYLPVSQKKEKVRVYVDISTYGTIIVIIDLLNITTSDAGIYTVKNQWDSKELNDSVVLRSIAESLIPRIYAAWHMSEDYSLVLQCITSNLFAKKITWKRNSSLIGNLDRYSLGNDSLSIRNLTAGDQYTSYTCMDQESELESDPYQIKAYSEYYMATTTLQKDDTEASAISYYVTTVEAHNYDTDINVFPSMYVLMYFLSGFSVLSAIGLFICLFKKIRERITVDRREGMPEESYWTIVSNAKGELTTAVETNTMQINESAANCNKTVAEINEVEASSQLYRLDVDIEFDGYIHPISSNPLTSVFASSQLTEAGTDL